MREPREFAGVILLTKKGELILQRRDNFPTIVDPGLLSIFAGRKHENESTQDAAVRVLEEETTIQAHADQLTFAGSFTKTVKDHGSSGVSHIYIHANVNPSGVSVHQGQGYEIIAIKNLDKKDTAPISYDILVSLHKTLTEGINT